jgi:uncharacterized OB-fold protein
MAMIQFVRNFTDHSNNQGYQFEFHCDKCGNGYMSKFQASALGMADSALKAAGSIFGGFLGRAAQGADMMKDSLRSKGRDEAFEKAVNEGKTHFKQCGRCGKWVCPEVCWNAGKSLCQECAPDLQQEIAAAQAEAAAQQVHEKAAQTDYVKNIDMTRDATALCPKCNAKVGAAKFCPECGTSINAKTKCAQCSAEMDAHAKFCPECGAKHS